MDQNEVKEKINKKDLNKMFWRLLAFQLSWNYERMQNLGYLFVMKPILKKVYKNSTKEEKIQAMKRHLEFFPIFGVTAAMEEQGGNNMGQAISAVKVGLMGPLAGLGDSLFWLTLSPIFKSLGASFASQGNPVFMIFPFLFATITLITKYYGISLGYEKGTSFLNEIKNSDILKRGTTIATILGLVIVGGLIPQMVIVNISAVITVNKVKIVIQKILDGIMPSLLPLIVTLICYRMIKRKKSSVVILLSIIVLSILLKWVKVL